MAFKSEWITQKGALTDDNRDYCGIALRGSEVLCIVVDGSTRDHQSGVLAEKFVRALADQFVADPAISSAENILPILNELTESLKTLYPAGRLSFLILFYSGGNSVTALHAGDCRLGRVQANGEVTWLTRAHTLANATGDIGDEHLARHDDRHILTRSFRPGKYCAADKRQFSLMGSDRLVIATDGYWADLDNEQKSAFMTKRFVPSSPRRDDVSCLVMSRLTNSDETAKQEGSENFYLVSS